MSMACGAATLGLSPLPDYIEVVIDGAQRSDDHPDRIQKQTAEPTADPQYQQGRRSISVRSICRSTKTTDENDKCTNASNASEHVREALPSIKWRIGLLGRIHYRGRTSHGFHPLCGVRIRPPIMAR